MRGLGPPRQSGPLDLDRLPACVKWPTECAAIPGGPLNPKAVIIIGSFFMLREIELSLALRRHLWFTGDGPNLCVFLRVAASKTDPQAISFTRHWGCLCSVAAGLYPAHTAKEHVDAMESVFGSQLLDEEGPLFPTPTGTFASKGGSRVHHRGCGPGVGP